MTRMNGGPRLDATKVLCSSEDDIVIEQVVAGVAPLARGFEDAPGVFLAAACRLSCAARALAAGRGEARLLQAVVVQRPGQAGAGAGGGGRRHAPAQHRLRTLYRDLQLNS